MTSSESTATLARLLRDTDSAKAAWQPLIFDRSRPDDVAAMDALLGRTDAVASVHDTIAAQISDLIETRDPEALVLTEVEQAGLRQMKRRLPAAARERAIAELLGGLSPTDFGRWVYYPWSKRLVHVLPESEFALLRGDRNRNKLTRDEQAKLSRLKVAVAGLSVGSAVAYTLALEGACGELRLADFDTLDLSNLNRLRGGVHEIGTNKAVLAARAIFELNPYARVRVFTEGVTPGNIDRIFTEGGAIDVLIEECDSFYMKLALRERARTLRIPVIMETSDRGMLDVERFDLEPDRPIFHGLLGSLRADDLLGLTTRQKVPYFLAIVGDRISERMRASLVEVEHSISGWPQLGADVTLGGATVTVAVRQLGLGLPLPSGRSYVDLEAHVASAAQPAPPQVLAPLAPPQRRAAAPAPGPRDRELLRHLVGAAIQAPSAGNNQPWRFHGHERTLSIELDTSRCRNAMDIGHRASLVAVGAALENARIAAEALGHSTSIALFPDGGRPDLVATLRLDGRTDVDATTARWAAQIERRCTNRTLAPRKPLAAHDATGLIELCLANGGRLHLASDDDARAELGEILGGGDTLRYLLPHLHHELMSEVRWTEDEATATSDGIDVRTLELDAADRAALSIIRDPAVAALVRKVGGGAALKEGAQRAASTASAFGLVTVESDTRADYVRGGQLIERLWLEATARDIAFYPMTPPFTFMRPGTDEGHALFGSSWSTLEALRERFFAVYPDARSRGLIIHARLGYAPPPAYPSLRRSVDEVLTLT